MRDLVVLFCLLTPGLMRCAPPRSAMKPDVKAALDSIRVSELRGDLSFLASDALEGRYTPSPGLNVAAEYIASKFRAEGLEPGGSNDYFQPAEMVERTLPKVANALICKQGDAGKAISVEAAQVRVVKAGGERSFVDVPVLKVTERSPEKLKGLVLDGKVVLAPMVDLAAATAAERMDLYLRMQAFDKAVAESKARLEVVTGTTSRRVPASQFLYAEDASVSAPPVVQVESRELADALKTPDPLTLSLEIPESKDKRVVVNNVIGILRGSDPKLKMTCVLLTAHYDHIGTTTGPDKIYNGANDDGSGTVSVIEISRALMQLHPRRSIVFVTFFGEERGLLGSTYYGRHPVFPIGKTVADINLEQVGRTDSGEGPEIANATLTGYDYSDVTKFLEDAGAATGIKVYKDDAGSDEYFVRSDNAALAEQGVPAHTLTTAFEYPDYHGVGDEWQKIDYDNMAKVDRMVALAVLNIANSRKAPAWNEENSKTEPFREAQKREQSKPVQRIPE